MSDFVQIYRNLFFHPSFINAPPSYRCVLLTIIAHACFAPCQQDDHGKIIDLKPGQFLTTIRSLAELSNVGRKDAEHAIKYFVKSKIVGQEVKHKKSLLTILWGIRHWERQEMGQEVGQEFTRVKHNKVGQEVGQEVGQAWDIKEEDIRIIKEEKKKTTTKPKIEIGGGWSSEDVILFNSKGQEIKMSGSDIYRHFLKFEYSTEIITQGIREIQLYKTPVNNILKCLEAICLRLHNLSKKILEKPQKKQKPDMKSIPKIEEKGKKFDIDKLKGKNK